MDDDSTPYESILVGYLCEAVGWLRRDAQARLEENEETRLVSAMNMSHNPLDPAVGDFILRLQEPGQMPDEFFLLELKRDAASLTAEREKISKKINGLQPSDFARTLEMNFPNVRTAHWVGLHHSIPTISRKCLALSHYWDAVVDYDRSEPQPEHVMRVLQRMMYGPDAPPGLPFESLVEYIRCLNASADPGSAAAWGTERFAFAHHQGEVFLFNERSILQHGENMVARLKERAGLVRVETPSG